MAIYNRFVRCLRVGYRALHPRWQVEAPPEEEGGCVYVVHHQNMKGPVRAIGLAAGESHIWSLHVFCDREACYKQFAEYTFGERYGWPEPLAKMTGCVLSWIIPGLMHAIGAVPVYRDMRSITTMRASMDVLLRGESLTICPDIDYASDSPEMGDMYTGFTMLDKLYRKRTGKALRFVPMHCSDNEKRVVYGEAVYHHAGETADEMAGKLRNGQLSLATACGDIEAVKGEADVAAYA